MKTLLVLITQLLLINSANAAGGFSGGGGNLINPTPPKSIQDPREIRMIIKGSRHLLARYLDAKYVLYKTGSMSYEDLKLFTPIFSNMDDRASEAMEEINLNIIMDQSCMDEKGNPVDGSTIDNRPDSVCISAFAIAKKCDRLEVPIQAAALILHEISEVFGANEDEAVKLQKEAITDLKFY